MKRVRYNRNAKSRPFAREYDPKYVKQAKFLCAHGATLVQLADAFEVNTCTVDAWRSKYPAFGKAVNEGRLDQFDPKIERSLAERALGYTVDTVEPYVVEGEIVDHPVRKHYPPDVTAAIFWLKNRKREQWRDRHEVDVATKVLRSADEIRSELISELQAASKKGLIELTAIDVTPKRDNKTNTTKVDSDDA